MPQSSLRQKKMSQLRRLMTRAFRVMPSSPLQREIQGKMAQLKSEIEGIDGRKYPGYAFMLDPPPSGRRTNMGYSNPLTHEQSMAAYGAGKHTGSDWRGRFTPSFVHREFISWLEYRRPVFQWIDALSAAELKRLEDSFAAGARYGWETQEVGPYPKTYPGVRRRRNAGRRNAGRLDTIHFGDRVTIMRYAGRGTRGPEYRPATGTAVMRGPHGWVLNMGGRYGTPGIADESNIVKVLHPRRRPGSASYMNRRRRSNAGRSYRYPQPMRFRELAVGQKFVFRSEAEWWSLGMAKGPWIKTGARTYADADDPSRRFRVGSINAEVAVTNRRRARNAGRRTYNPMPGAQTGDWASYEYRDKRGIKRIVTGLVVGVTSDGLVSVRSDGGQPGYKRGTVFSVWSDDPELNYSTSPHAPHKRRNAGRYSIRKTKKRLKKIGVRSFRAKFRARRLRNPQTRLFRVHVPSSRIDPKGYDMTISAATKRSARNEARHWCAQTYREQTGRPMAEYRLPRGTKVTEVYARAAANPKRNRRRRNIFGLERQTTYQRSRELTERAAKAGFYRDVHGWHRKRQRSASGQLALLQQISQDRMGKSYRSLSPAQRESVKQIASRAANHRRRNARSYRTRRRAYYR